MLWTVTGEVELQLMKEARLAAAPITMNTEHMRRFAVLDHVSDTLDQFGPSEFVIKCWLVTTQIDHASTIPENGLRRILKRRRSSDRYETACLAFYNPHIGHTTPRTNHG